MHPLRNGSQATERPATKPLFGEPGWFTESGEDNRPSYPGADWFNHVIAEFTNSLAVFGVNFDPQNDDHLAKAFEYVQSAIMPHKSIKALRPVAGLVQKMESLVEGIGLGGGDVIYYPTMDWSLHDGGTVWAKQSVDAFSGSMEDLPTLHSKPVDSGVGCYKRILLAGTAKAEVCPEMWGAVGDWDWESGGTVNTSAVRNMFNASSKLGAIIRCEPGGKYLTDTVYLYNHPEKNPNYMSKAGRVCVIGNATGIATGNVEPQGSAFVHIDGASRPLFECIGNFTLEDAGDTGGYIEFTRVNLIGGNQSTHVVYEEACTGSIVKQYLTVRIRNPSGNGLTENTTWESKLLNILIRGDATGDGSWTGVALDVKDNGSLGQVNMKVYENVNCYKTGYGKRFGRRNSNGTLGPLVVVGGQNSYSDHYGTWLDGGVYNFTSTGHQEEQTRFNGLKIDSDGASDIERNITITNPYFTHCGKVVDGTTIKESDCIDALGNITNAEVFETFKHGHAIDIYDGEGVCIENPIFQNIRSGIIFNRNLARNLTIELPLCRTVSAYGASYGSFISSYGQLNVARRHTLKKPQVANGTSTLIDSRAKEAFAYGEAGERLSTSSNLTVPSCDLGFATANESARILNFNNSTVTNVTDISGGTFGQKLVLTFSNTNTTIKHNASTIWLDQGNDFTPKNNRATLTLFYTGTVWIELSRSFDLQFYAERIIYKSAVPVSLTGTETDTILLDVNIPVKSIGINGHIEADLCCSYSSNSNIKRLRFTFGPSIVLELNPTSSDFKSVKISIFNRGASGSQIAISYENGVAHQPITLNVDTEIAQTFRVSAKLNDVSDLVVLESSIVRVVH